jgi:hypothetical protein
LVERAGLKPFIEFEVDRAGAFLAGERDIVYISAWLKKLGAECKS